jgi:hypothetical protein
MGAWEQLRGELAVANDRDFERLVLSLLRLFWPNLVRPRGLGAFDRAGIDLMVPGERDDLPCVVQCKGFFSSDQLDQSHYRQIRSSIDAFLQSNFGCQEFVLVHNRTNANRAITYKIHEDLSQLIVSGKAARIRLWDRQSLVRDLRSKLDSLIAMRLREEAAWLLSQISRIFQFGGVYVSRVPVSEHKLTLRRYMTPKLEELRGKTSAKISDLVLSPAETRWTLLTGTFGSGKSSAALHAALEASGSIVFARCSEMTFDSGAVSTNLLLHRAVSSLRLFDDFDDEDRTRFDRLAGPTLRSALSRTDNQTILVLDGLDENRIFSSTTGMIALSNALAELRCPIVLTTRQEHFDATFGNFDQAIDDLTSKGGSSRSARLFKLEPWGTAETTEFLRQAIGMVGPDRCAGLNALLTYVQNEKTDEWPRELLAHPIFLQMMAELAANGDIVPKSRTDAITEWVSRKISRDISVPRLTPVDIVDRSSFVEKVVGLMQRVAALMLRQENEQYELLETIDSDLVIRESSVIFANTTIDVTAIVGVSLLVPATQRKRHSVPLKFSHRAFQEYFTAVHVLRQGLDDIGFPAPVRSLVRELRST